MMDVIYSKDIKLSNSLLLKLSSNVKTFQNVKEHEMFLNENKLTSMIVLGDLFTDYDFFKPLLQNINFCNFLRRFIMLTK